MSRNRTFASVAALAAVVAVLIAGCGRPLFDYRPDSGSMTFLEAQDLARAADISGVADLALEDAPARRTEVLTSLRTKGADGKRAAELLTEGFPVRNAAVPVLIVFADVDGVRSLVAVEAYKGADGKLSRRRLWVFDLKTGAIGRSATFR